jgi:hypothetical protein
VGFYVFANEHHRETYLPPSPASDRRCLMPASRTPNRSPPPPPPPPSPPISDAAVERLVRWLTHHWAGAPACVLITNSAAAASAAAARGLNSTTIHALVKQASAGKNRFFYNPISVNNAQASSTCSRPPLSVPAPPPHPSTASASPRQFNLSEKTFCVG